MLDLRQRVGLTLLNKAVDSWSKGAFPQNKYEKCSEDDIKIGI